MFSISFIIFILTVSQQLPDIQMVADISSANFAEEQIKIREECAEKNKIDPIIWPTLLKTNDTKVNCFYGCVKMKNRLITSDFKVNLDAVLKDLMQIKDECRRKFLSNIWMECFTELKDEIFKDECEVDRKFEECKMNRIEAEMNDDSNKEVKALRRQEGKKFQDQCAIDLELNPNDHAMLYLTGRIYCLKGCILRAEKRISDNLRIEKPVFERMIRMDIKHECDREWAMQTVEQCDEILAAKRHTGICEYTHELEMCLNKQGRLVFDLGNYS